MKTEMDFYPTQAYFKDARDVSFHLTSTAPFPAGSRLRLQVYHLDQLIHTSAITLPANQQETNLDANLETLRAEVASAQGFIAVCRVKLGNGETKYFSTAFDLAVSWFGQPRYGYLCDFKPERQDSEIAVEELLKFHINGLQFYDWQYRHEQLLPKQALYKDVLGRSLSLKIVRELMNAAQQRGMACMPYLAIYGASRAYWRKHQDEALYDADGRPELFHDFLGLMNPAPQSAWSDHLAGECDCALEKLPFDGLHIDQYGQPHKVFNHSGQPVDLPQAFVAFIDRMKNTHEEKCIVFNAVDNWPIEALCRSRQDFMYIEIWPPSVQYTDLLDIIRNAQRLSSHKPVVLALYIPAAWTANARLSSALIFAAGATRIELGEGARYLSDPYFPKHQALSPVLYKNLRRYYDFMVAYREWLQPSGETIDCEITAPPDVLTLTNRVGSRQIIQILNFCQISVPRWDKRHRSPQILRDTKIMVSLSKAPLRVFTASADAISPQLQPLPYTYSNGICSMNLPKLKYWSMLCIEME